MRLCLLQQLFSCWRKDDCNFRAQFQGRSSTFASYRRAAQVYSILRHVAEVLEYTKDEQLESLYQRTAWVFDKKYNRPGYGAYDVFKQAVS